MKIVVACAHDEVCGLGKSNHLHVYTVENNEIVNEEKVHSPEEKHGHMADFVADLNPDVVIVEHAGEKAVEKFAEKNITFVQNASGKPTDAAKAYLAGTLTADSDEGGCGCHSGGGHGGHGKKHGNGGGCGCSH